MQAANQNNLDEEPRFFGSTCITPWKPDGQERAPATFYNYRKISLWRKIKSPEGCII